MDRESVIEREGELSLVGTVSSGWRVGRASTRHDGGVVACSWGDPTRIWGKVSEAIRSFVGRLVAAMNKRPELEELPDDLDEVVAKTCRRNKRKKPGTSELLNDVSLLNLVLT
jgi:hypothetical protein